LKALNNIAPNNHYTASYYYPHVSDRYNSPHETSGFDRFIQSHI